MHTLGHDGDDSLIIYIGEFEKATNETNTTINLSRTATGLGRLVEVDRVIDGHHGRVANGYHAEAEADMYMAGWPADDRTGVSLISTYP